MKIVFAHNTLSSYRPKGIRGMLFNWASKCQSKSITELYNKGVRGFDIRFRVKNHKMIACHGLVDYDIDVDEAFIEILKNKAENEKIFIRIIHEDTFINSSIEEFKEAVDSLMKKYPEFIYKVYLSKSAWKIYKNGFKSKELEFTGSKVAPFPPPSIFSDLYNSLFWTIYERLRNGFYYFDFI